MTQDEKRIRWILMRTGRRAASPMTITGSAIDSPMRGCLRYGTTVIARQTASGRWIRAPSPWDAIINRILDGLDNKDYH